VQTWLFKIAHNTYLNHLKKSGGLKEESLEDFDAKSNTDAFSISDERTIVRKILKMLSETERTLIILRDMNDLTYSEISSIMGLNEGQVKIGLHRARKRFRDLYKVENREG